MTPDKDKFAIAASKKACGLERRKISKQPVSWFQVSGIGGFDDADAACACACALAGRAGTPQCTRSNQKSTTVECL